MGKSPVSSPRGVRLSPRYVRMILLALLLCIWLGFSSFPSPLSSSPIRGYSGSATSKGKAVFDPAAREFLPLKEAQAVCSAENMDVYKAHSRRRKIYDLFLVSHELDWTEIRINTLAPYVDYFIIVESTRTFTDHPKPLHFRTNFTRFLPFQSQIIYHLIDPVDMKDNSTWDRESYQRNAMMDEVFPNLIGDAAPQLDDIILVSDVDEIPRPSTLVTLRNCIFSDRLTIFSHFFYYSFQWEHPNVDWHHPQATYWKGFTNTVRPQELRMGPIGAKMKNAAWHCSWCFDTMERYRHKIVSWSHTEHDKPQFKIPSEIVRRIRHGKDLFDRQGQDLVRVNETRWDLDSPPFIKQEADRFAFLLDRDPHNANLADYVPDEDEPVGTTGSAQLSS